MSKKAKRRAGARTQRAAVKPGKTAVKSKSTKRAAAPVKARPGTAPKSAPRLPPAPGKSASLMQQAYEQIKEKIITVFFLPGQYLNEAAICDMLGLGRTPVHQALQQLERDRMVEIMPRKGVIVLPDSIAEIIKILDSRLAVEPELARHAATLATPEGIEELRALAGLQKPDAQMSDIDAFTTSDRAFHRKVAEMSGNQVLSDFARNLHERSWRYWYLHLWQTLDIDASTRQHTAIVEAISAGDGAAAAEGMRAHIDALKQRLSQIQSARGQRLDRG